MDFSNSLSSISANIMANYVLEYIKKENLRLLLSYERRVLISKEFIISLLKKHSKLCDLFVEPLKSYEKFYDFYINDITLTYATKIEYDLHEEEHVQNIAHKIFCSEVWHMIHKQVYIMVPTVLTYDNKKSYTMTAAEFYSNCK